jgi:hypothetical protein
LAYFVSLARTDFHDQSATGRQIPTRILQESLMALCPARSCHQRSSRFEVPDLRLKIGPIRLRNIRRVRDHHINAPVQLLFC